MRLDHALNGVTRLRFDTPPVIYFIEQHPTYDPLLRPIFRRISAGGLAGITSVVTLVEALTLPMARANRELVRRYRGVLLGSRNFQTVEIDATVADRAAALRARYRLRTPDALQLAAALTHHCEAFLTNDRDLARVRELRLLLLDELEP